MPYTPIDNSNEEVFGVSFDTTTSYLEGYVNERDGDTLYFQALYSLATRYKDSGRYEEAEKLYEELVDLPLEPYFEKVRMGDSIYAHSFYLIQYDAINQLLDLAFFRGDYDRMMEWFEYRGSVDRPYVERLRIYSTHCDFMYTLRQRDRYYLSKYHVQKGEVDTALSYLKPLVFKSKHVGGELCSFLLELWEKKYGEDSVRSELHPVEKIIVLDSIGSKDEITTVSHSVAVFGEKFRPTNSMHVFRDYPPEELKPKDIKRMIAEDVPGHCIYKAIRERYE